MTDELNPALAQTLGLVAPQRRSSLAKLLVAQLMIGGAVALTAPAMTTIAMAEDGAKPSESKSDPNKSTEKPVKSTEKKARATDSSEPQAKVTKAKAPADPSKLAKQWIKKFDADGDGCLGQEELTLAIQAMQESAMNATAAAATKGPSDAKTKSGPKADAKSSAKSSEKTSAKTKPAEPKAKPSDS